MTSGEEEIRKRDGGSSGNRQHEDSYIYLKLKQVQYGRRCITDI